MNKKLFFSFVLMVMAAIIPAKAAELTVFEGTATSQYVPAYVYYWDDFTRAQTVIPATELEYMTGGTISAIKFYTNSTNIPYTSVAEADVYLMEVGYTEISAFEPKDNGTMVYQGIFDFVANADATGGELTITFTTPYTYNGGNLLIGIENTTDAQYKTINFKGQTLTGASISGYNSSSLEGVNPTQRNFVPMTTFTYTPGEGPIYYKPTNLVVSDITTNGAKVTWTPGSTETAWNVEYKKAADEEWTAEAVTGTPELTLDALENNTNYEVRVQADYGDGNLSSFTAPVSFTTLRCDDMGNVTYNLVDSYGDGWNGASITVVDAATEEIVQTLTVTGNSNNGTIGMCYGETYNFIWNSGSYDSECSLTLTDPFGEVIFTGRPSASGQFATYTYAEITNPTPKNLAVDDITATTAKASWEGEAETYNVRYRKAEIYDGFFEGFEGVSTSGLPTGWTTIDADGDGYNWYVLNFTESGLELVDANGNPTVMGECVMTSASWLSNSNILTPDNWLISPQIEFKGSLSLLYRGQDPGFPDEHFAVYITTGDPTNTENFTELIAETEAGSHFEELTADLSAYDGQQGYIAIRHFNSTDIFRLNIDNFFVGNYTPAGEWTVVENVENPYTIEGLDPETEYEVEVQGVYPDEVSEWTAPVNFTTLEAPVPEKAYYLIGAFNTWDQENMIPFEEEDGVFTLTYEFGGEFKIKDEAGNWWGGGVTLTEENPSVTLIDGGNLNLNQAAEYTLTIEDGVLTVTGFPEPQVVEYDEFYVVGTFNNWNTEEGDGRIELVANEDETEFTGIVELEAEAQFKIITPTEFGIKWFGGESENGMYFLINDDMLDMNISLIDGANFKVEEAGEYNITVKAAPESTLDKGVSEPLVMVVSKVATGISTIGVDGYDNNAWYNLNGQKLNGKPTTPGIYINGHKKVVIK